MSDLLDTTLELALAKVAANDRGISQMCEVVGVSPRWFYKFANGRIPDPSVRRVQRLHDYLVAESSGSVESGRAA